MADSTHLFLSYPIESVILRIIVRALIAYEAGLALFEHLHEVFDKLKS
jgi:hypothetical protein